MRQHALIENIQRDELNPIDLAQAYQELIEIHQLTHDQLSLTVHKSRAQITNTLRLLQLGDKGRKALAEGKITAGHAKVIVGLEPSEQALMVDSIIGQKLSVRDVESMVKKIKLPSAHAATLTESERLDLSALKKRLNDLGYKCGTKGDRLTIEFENNGQIASFLGTLS